MKKILTAIEQKYQNLSSFMDLGDMLSGSEVNSVFLEMFKMQAAKIQATDLVKQFTNNRFVVPSTVDVLAYKKLELEYLEFANEQGFKPIILSPLTPLGTCSTVGEVNQNNVVSALRGTEVVADVTNVLALKIAADFKKNKSPDVVKYATTHRHVRGQAFTNPAFTAHFGVFCLVSGGIDTGSYQFEIGQLIAHIDLHYSLLSSKFDSKNLEIKIHLRQENPYFIESLEKQLSDKGFHFKLIEDYQKGDYYKMVQFKIYLKYKDMDLDLADGGLVDWTQKLIPNKKHRLFISGCGIEIVHKILDGQL